VERLGDILKSSELVKCVRDQQEPPPPPSTSPPLTLFQKKMLDAATAIRLDPDAVERAYMARELVQCTLPHKNPGQVERWLRRNGNAALVIQAGWDTKKDRSVGYPYGTIPRLLLFWITTEAVKTKSRRLELGHNLSEFMRELELDPGRGGKRSDARRLRDQMERLFRCRISFDQVITRADGKEANRWLDMQVAPEGELWWDPKRPDQGVLWGSWIELGEKFFQAIIAAPVPADMRALRALKRSALALDLYVWLAYRVYLVNRNGEPLAVSWESLARQTGCDFGDVRDFRRKALAAIGKIKAVYPGLNLSTKARGRLVLRPSRLAIAPAVVN
jgi:replication initiator protein